MKLSYRITSAVLAVALVATTATFASADSKEDSKQTNATNDVLAATAQQLAASSQPKGKEETVYVLTDAQGNNPSIIVSNWLKNPEGADTLKDVSDLTDIENLKADFTYTEDGDNKVWNAGGKDVYYSGNSDKEAPVDVTLKYTLDDQEITPEELAGKSGKVTITFTYTDKQTATIGSQKLYVPFAAVSATLLDNSKFTNIEVTNGKVINDGDRCIVAGFAFPGLAENMAAGGMDILPKEVVITADVEDFSLEGTLTALTDDIFNGIDLSSIPSLNGLTSKLGDVVNQTSSLMTGLEQLAAGITELNTKFAEYQKGIVSLNTGITQVSGGVSQVSAASSQINTGAAQLSGGLAEIDKNSEALVAGAQQTFSALLASADAQLKAAGLTVPALTIDTYKAVLTKVNAQANSTAITALIAQLDSYNEFYQGVVAYTQGVSQSAKGSAELAAGAKAMDTGVAQLKAGTDALVDGGKKLAVYTVELQAGIKKLADGSAQITAGLQQFTQGMSFELSGASSDTLSYMISGLKMSAEAAKTYTSFSGKSDDVNSSVKFIYTTSAID